MSTRSPAVRRPAVRLAVAALATASLGWAAVPPAAAHDELLSSDPAESGILAALPSRAILTFTGPVAEVHEVTVTGPDGSVTNGAATSTGPEVRQNLWAGPDGTYTMTYDVVSSDGHEIAGEIRFEVGGTAPAGADEDGSGASSALDSSDAGGGLGDVVVPASVVLLSAALALVIWQRRRAARSTA